MLGGWNIVTQLVIAVLAMAGLAALGSIDPATFSTALGNAADTVSTVERAATRTSIGIGLEHESSAVIDMLIARKGDIGRVDVTNATDRELKIRLPEGWARTEARGGSLWLVTEEDPEFGSVRWTLPARMTMVLSAPVSPDVITFSSQSLQPASVRVTMVDLDTQASNNHTVLFQGTATVDLWERE